MTTISSPHNPRLKALRRLHRRRERERTKTFIAEGEDLIDAARHAGRVPLEGFCARGSGLADRHLRAVEPEALAAISTLASGTRALAVYQQRWQEVSGPLCVYLHGVADPGNVGTIVRAAATFGAACVALGPGCADPHSPRAVRASMGAIFSVALARAAGPRDLPGQRIALMPDARRSLAALPAAVDELTVLVGGEREGLPQAIAAACEQRVRLAARGRSLNAAMAATIALYELTRTRVERAPSSRVRPS